MALEKVITYDYEVRSGYKHIQVRQKTAITEDGKELSYSYHRRVLTPDMDVSSESDEIDFEISIPSTISDINITMQPPFLLLFVLLRVLIL